MDCDAGTVTVFTDDPSYDMLVTSLTLEVISVQSSSAQNSDSVTFVVEVKNVCRRETLEPAEWFQTFVKFDFRTTVQNLIEF